jgi:hypothetical protein
MAHTLTDPNNGPAYLPQYNGKGGVSDNSFLTGARAPDPSGWNQAVTRNNDFWKSVDLFNKALVNLPATYYEIALERDSLALTNEVTKTLDARKLEVFSTRRGAKADGLIEDELKYTTETRDKLMESSGLGAPVAAKIIDQHNRAYLSEVKNFQLQQGLVAKENAKFDLKQTWFSELAMVSQPDTNALANTLKQLNGLYVDDPQKLAQAWNEAIDVAIDNWGAKAPQQTLQWWKAQRDGLGQLLGKHFGDADKAMMRLERRMEQSINLGMAQQMRNMRNYEYMRTVKGNHFVDEGMKAFAVATREGQQENFDFNLWERKSIEEDVPFESMVQFKKMAKAYMGVKDEFEQQRWSKQFLKMEGKNIAEGKGMSPMGREFFAYGMENGFADMKIANSLSASDRSRIAFDAKSLDQKRDSEEAYYSGKIVNNDMTPQDWSELNGKVGNREITTEAYSRITRLNENTQDAVTAGVSEAYHSATNVLKNILMPTSAMDPFGTGGEIAMYGQAQDTLIKMLKSAKTPEEREAILNQDPKSGSVVSKMIQRSYEYMTKRPQGLDKPKNLDNNIYSDLMRMYTTKAQRVDKPKGPRKPIDQAFREILGGGPVTPSGFRGAEDLGFDETDSERGVE